VRRVLLPALLLTATLVGRAEPQSDGVAASGAAGPVVGGVLRPTDHPRLPRDLSQLWMAPEKGRARTAAQANLATAIKFELDGSHARALVLLSHPATAQAGPLGAYLEFYKGLAQLHLGRPAEARVTFQALQSRELVGYLVELSALREAECDEALGDRAAALAVYERLAALKTTVPDDVLMRVGKAAKSIGDAEKARAAFERVYYEFPFSELSDEAAGELGTEPIVPGNPRYRRELSRAERLFAARKYGPARAAFERLRAAAQDDDRDLVRLRLAEADYFLKRPRNTRDGVRPFLDLGPHQAEALFFEALSLHDLGDRSQYLALIQRVVTEFPTDSWAEEALNNLGTSYIREDDDALADQTFRQLYEKFPAGRYAERAAWKIGWRAYRTGEYRETASVFSRAAADFPRSDYRPSWLYWAGRAHDALGERPQAQARYSLAALDYLNSYYGRLALARLGGRVPERRLVASLTGAVGRAGGAGAGTTQEGPASASSLPPNAPVVRELLVAKIYEQAIDELRYAQNIWGESSSIGATMAWTYREQGKLETGSTQFSLYRGAINLMKRAYPQYLAAGGEQLPRDILRIIFPIAYWEPIQKYAAEHGLDPYLVVALAAQESTFVANIRSPAKAVGLLQLEAATAKQYARRLNMSYSSRTLIDPEANIRIGTAYLADKVREFGDLHLVLASYNAGERPVHRWMSERPGLPGEEFIDDIPYPETQNYVRKILGTAEDYRRLYGSAAGVIADDEIPPNVRATSAASDVKPAPGTKKKAPVAKPVRKRRRAA
jgi:soluble lytic murein transglycosylase